MACSFGPDSQPRLSAQTLDPDFQPGLAPGRLDTQHRTRKPATSGTNVPVNIYCPVLVDWAPSSGDMPGMVEAPVSACFVMSPGTRFQGLEMGSLW